MEFQSFGCKTCEEALKVLQRFHYQNSLTSQISELSRPTMEKWIFQMFKALFSKLYLLSLEKENVKKNSGKRTATNTERTQVSGPDCSFFLCEAAHTRNEQQQNNWPITAIDRTGILKRDGPQVRKAPPTHPLSGATRSGKHTWPPDTSPVSFIETCPIAQSKEHLLVVHFTMELKVSGKNWMSCRLHMIKELSDLSGGTS